MGLGKQGWGYEDCSGGGPKFRDCRGYVFPRPAHMSLVTRVSLKPRLQFIHSVAEPLVKAVSLLSNLTVTVLRTELFVVKIDLGVRVAKSVEGIRSGRDRRDGR